VKGQGKLKAYLLSATCWDECGPAIVAVRNTRNQVVAAKRLDDTCTMGGKLSARTLFSRKEQTLELRCRAGSGAQDYSETATLYQLERGELRPLLSAHMGMGVTWPRGRKMCQVWAPGSIKVERTGLTPTLRLIEFDDDPNPVGTIDALKTRYRYDSTRRTFVRMSTMNTQVTVREKCVPSHL